MFIYSFGLMEQGCLDCEGLNTNGKSSTLFAKNFNDMILAPAASVTITVQAKEHYGGSPTLSVQAGEVYSFQAPPGQCWKDAYLSSGPDGIFNFLLWFAPPRLKKVRCFTLCGAIGKTEDHLFRIGSKLERFTMPASGELYFFANDAWKFYGNNKGEMQVVVTRIS